MDTCRLSGDTCLPKAAECRQLSPALFFFLASAVMAGSNGEMKAEVGLRMKGLGYIDEFLMTRCAGDLLDLKLYPNAKEVTESFSMFSAIRKHLKEDFDPKDPSIVCIVVGDGCTPRTAAMISYRTRWTVHSVDPMMKLEGSWSKKVRNLTVYRSPVEEVAIPVKAGGKVLVLCMHTHVTLESCLYAIRRVAPDSDKNPDPEELQPLPRAHSRHPCSPPPKPILSPRSWQPLKVGIVACPCCQFTEVQKTVFGIPADISYDDRNILSEHHRVYLWRNVGSIMHSKFSNPKVVMEIWKRERVARYPKRWIRKHQDKLARSSLIRGAFDWGKVMKERLSSYKTKFKPRKPTHDELRALRKGRRKHMVQGLLDAVIRHSHVLLGVFGFGFGFLTALSLTNFNAYRRPDLADSNQSILVLYDSSGS